MKCVTSIISKLIRPFTYVLGLMLACVVGILMPKRGKRIICAVSLYAHMDDIDPILLEDKRLKEYLHEVNALLRLINRDDNAMRMPLFIHQYIWGHLRTSDIQQLRELSPEEACDRLLKKMPWFLRYHNRVMREDAMVILQHQVYKSPQLDYAI